MPSFLRSSSIAFSTSAFSPALSTPAWSVTLPETPNGASARAGPPPARSRTADRPRTTGSRRTTGTSDGRGRPVRDVRTLRTSGRRPEFPAAACGEGDPAHIPPHPGAAVPEPDRIPAAELPPGSVRGHGDWAVGNRGDDK